MKLNYEVLNNIACEYGDSFYLLDCKQFIMNFLELQKAFRDYYPKSQIAYSYKTNYTPALCKIVNDLGGYAEIVSDMEYEIAKRIGVKPGRIIFNGPYKNPSAVEELLLTGGIVNIDSLFELNFIDEIAKNHPEVKINVGIRCNFAINDNTLSRFGIDVLSDDFQTALDFIEQHHNINLSGLHCHFAARNLETWPVRTKKMIDLANNCLNSIPEHIDLGGGLFGNMGKSLKEQFSVDIPQYCDYAEAAAKQFAAKFNDYQPILFIEPGSALVGDAMKFASKVINIKEIRGKAIATLLGSIYNINPTLNKKNLPVNVYHGQSAHRDYQNLDFGGFTCIESDYLYRGYCGELAVDDYVVFDNVGSYSIVLKPPFILPNFAVVEYNDETDICRLIKRQETFDDLFHTYIFE